MTGYLPLSDQIDRYMVLKHINVGMAGDCSEHGPLNLCPRHVACVQDATSAVSPFTGEVVVPLGGTAREFDSPLNEAPDCFGPSGEDLPHKLGVSQECTGLHGVGNMLVDGVAVVPDSRNTTLSIGSVRESWFVLGEYDDRAVLGYSQRSTEPSQAGANDKEVATRDGRGINHSRRYYRLCRQHGIVAPMRTLSSQLQLLSTLSLLLAMSVPASAGSGDIYMGTTSDGVLTFTDTPPSGDESFSIYLRVLDGRPAKWAQVDPALMKKNIDRWDSIILRAAATYKVSPELIKAIILVESGMNSKATSPAGAQGLMQLMPATAEGLGVDRPYDPDQNIFGGTRYIRKMLDKFSDRRLALAAYNAGPGNVRKYGGIPPFRETEYYVEKVLKYYALFLSQRPLSR